MTEPNLLDSPWAEDHYDFPSGSKLKQMIWYLSFARACWDKGLLAPFPPGAKAECDGHYICEISTMEKTKFFDVKASSVGKHFMDNVAFEYILKERTAPLGRVETVATTMTKSLFDPLRLERGYRDIASSNLLPQHTPPVGIIGVLSRAISRVKSRWTFPQTLHSCRPEDIPFHPGSLAGIKYTGPKRDNFDKALTIRDTYEFGFISNGFSLQRSTPFAQLCRLQVSTREEPKHRNVAADTFHRYLQDGITAHPYYDALKLTNLPCTFGFNLTKQAAVREKLLIAHPEANFELVGDFPSFDIGKILDRGTVKERFSTGVRSWEIRFAFMVIASAFGTDDLDATISLVMGQAYTTFKKVVYRFNCFTFYETLPSGCYLIYVLDSIICDMRMELVALSLGDPLSSRIVGGDDSYTALRIRQFDLKQANLVLKEIGTELSDAPKTQFRYTNDRTAPPLKFHGHKTLFSGPFRAEDDVICSCLLLERADNDDLTVSAGRLKAIWIDAGRRPQWLHRVVNSMEQVLGRSVEPSFLWHDTMWHAPLLLR